LPDLGNCDNWSHFGEFGQPVVDSLMFPTIAARRRSIAAGGAVMLLLIAGASSAVMACDICAIYPATEMQETRTGLRLGLAQQYSHFTTLQKDGDEIANPDDERLDSVITQFLLGYQVHPRVRLQMNVPVIFRDFRRVTATGVNDADENGLGDLSITGNVLVWSNVSEQSVVRLSVLGGLKFPTGNADRLKEEVPPDPNDVLNGQHFGPASDYGGGAHSGVQSGIHGHDLALGTGSFDPVFGGHLLVTWEHFYWATDIQYVVRTRGDFDYEYADELTAETVPGAYLLTDPEYTLGLGAALTTETKGKDNIDGTDLDDTGITSLYAGPVIQFTWGSSLSAELIADLPAIQNNTAVQLVPDFRIRGGLVWRF